MDELNEVLLSIDLDIVGELEHSETRRIQHGVEQSLQHLVRLVAEADDRFQCNIHGVGSYYSATKINRPDEFDFLLELAAFSDLESFKLRPPSFHAYNEKRIRDTGTYKIIQIIDEAMIRKWKDTCVNVATKTRPVYVLDQTEVKVAYFCVTDRVWETFRGLLPRGFTAQSCQLGPGPSLILELAWHGRRFPHLLISIDLSLAIHIPLWHEGYDFHRRYPDRTFSHVMSKLMAQTGYHLVPCVADPEKRVPEASWKISCSLAETCLFYNSSQYAKPLILVRLLKHVKKLFFTMNKPNPMDPSLTQDEAHEKLTEREMISSYIVKQVVFHVMIKTPVQYWRKAPVAKLFLDTLLFLFKVLQRNQLRDVFNSKHMLTIDEEQFRCIDCFMDLLDFIEQLYSQWKIPSEKLEPVFDYISDIVTKCNEFNERVEMFNANLAE